MPGIVRSNRTWARRVLFVVPLLVSVAAGPVAAASDGSERSARTVQGSSPLSASSRGHRLDARLWKRWWGGASVRGADAVLWSVAPKRRLDTHSSLVTTRRQWVNFTLNLKMGALRQLRRGDAPNPWETAWVMFRFRDLHDYYYFILKPNGWELGKKQGSDAQVFLASGSSPRLPIGDVARLRIRAAGPRIEVSVDGALVVAFTDPSPLRGGAVGLYEEDAIVRFSAVKVLASAAPSGGSRPMERLRTGSLETVAPA